jgi:hypothetical protein
MVCETISQKKPFTKKAGGMAQSEGREFKRQYQKKKDGKMRILNE